MAEIAKDLERLSDGKLFFDPKLVKRRMEEVLEKQVNRIINIKAVFSSYYKYTFYYKAQYKGKSLTLYIGGSSGDIYRLSLDAEHSFEIDESKIEFNEKEDNYTYEEQDEY